MGAVAISEGAEIAMMAAMARSANRRSRCGVDRDGVGGGEVGELGARARARGR
jgi:hypothetical protein